MQAPRTADRTAHAAARAAAPQAGRGRFRPEVQALRALAIALVVVFHFWPGALPGGFVGVDVFFVVSGFLITGQLLREVDRSGRVRLGEFWARRARRLLPAALTTLAAVGVLTWLVAPKTVWQQYFSDIAASAGYVQNWHLVAQAVDYFAPSGASPVQNFWSLAVEEQFYLAWPLIITAVLLVLRHRRRGTAWALAVVFAAVTAASLAASIHTSIQQPQVAYLSTLTRGWEFGLGGLLAFVLPRWEARAGAATATAVRAALSWAGIVAVVASAFLIDGSTPFPGTAALLPTLGTCAVIAAGLPLGRWWAPGRLLALPAVQWLGDASYSLYLWHWPLIVLAPFVLLRLTGHGGPWWLTPVVLVVSVLAAGASKRWIEDPTRRAPFWSGARPRRTLALTALGMAAVCAVALTGTVRVQTGIGANLQRTAHVVQTTPDCFGATSITPPPGSSCRDGASALASLPTMMPSPASVHEDIPKTCQVSPSSTELGVCSVGVPAARATTTVALVGDSHAAQWEPALARVARQKRWHVVLLLKGSCAFNAAPRSIGSGAEDAHSCTVWNRKVAQKLRTIHGLSLVVTSSDIKDLFRASSGRTGYQNAVAGYVRAWRGLPAGVHVDVIADTPRPIPDVVDCLALHHTDAAPGAACSRTESSAVGDDPLVAAAHALPGRTRLLTMTDDFCTAGSCDAVIGHVTVYRDASHMSATYSRTLADALGSAMADANAPAHRPVEERLDRPAAVG